jgi:predicted metal-binding membrane protein
MAPPAPGLTAAVAAEPPPAVLLWLADGGRRALVTVVLPLLAVAALAWAVTALRSDMMLGAGPFLSAWLIMMVAMMLPAVAPVVGLYALAARRGVVPAVPVFIAGYLCVWAATGVPAYLVSRTVAEPLVNGQVWVGRLVGATVLTAAVYQLTPLKDACLRRCRSPLSFYLTRRHSLSQPGRAFTAGAQHGLYCLGCCWALMAVLVVVGGMQLGWALGLALIISAEKLLPARQHVRQFVAAAGATFGMSLLLAPSTLDNLILM